MQPGFIIPKKIVGSHVFIDGFPSDDVLQSAAVQSINAKVNIFSRSVK